MGARKSQLVIETCYSFKGKNPDTWVSWVHGSNLAPFRQHFEEIVHVAKIPGFEPERPFCTYPEGPGEPEERPRDHGESSRQTVGVDFLSLVSRWLHDTPRRWFMVLDNADDHNLFFATPVKMAEPLSIYIPETLNGVFLVTNRDRVVGF